MERMPGRFGDFPPSPWSFNLETEASSSDNHLSWDPAASQIAPEANFDQYFTSPYPYFVENQRGIYSAVGTGFSSGHITCSQSLESSMNQLSLSGIHTSSPQYSQFNPHPFASRNSILQRRTMSASSGVFPCAVAPDLLRSTPTSMQNEGRSFFGASSVPAAPLLSSPEQICLNRIGQLLINRLSDGRTNGNLGMHIPPPLSRRRTFNRVESSEPFSSLPSVYKFQDFEFQLLSRELRGKVAFLAKGPDSSKMLLPILRNATQHLELVDLMFREIKDEMLDLSVHNCANYVVQNLIGACNEDQISQLLITFLGSKERFEYICMDAYGTRPVQELVKKISTREQRSLLLSVLRPLALIFAFNTNAYHVIVQCILSFPDEETKDIVHDLADCFLEAARHRKGCRVLQSCLAGAESRAKERILAETTANALLLSQDEFGNYVVQYAIAKLEEPQYAHVLGNIAAMLQGNFVTLSMDKYASNVVENLLQCSSIRGATEITSTIINEIMNHPSFLLVLQDKYGNFVAQKALSFSTGRIRDILTSRILSYQSQLQSHLYGGKVLAKVNRRRR